MELQRAADLLVENGCRADEHKVVAPPSDSESGPLMILAAYEFAPLASRQSLLPGNRPNPN